MNLCLPNRLPIFTMFPLFGFIPLVRGEVSVWGGGIGFSDVAANWVGGVLPPPENTITVNAGKLKGRGLEAVKIEIAAGAEAYA